MSKTISDPSNITQMADIFMPSPPQTLVSDGLLFFIPCVILGFIILFYKWFKAPLVKLTRDLKQAKLSPRETAHCLAHLLAASENKQQDSEVEISKKIDQLRFQRHAPKNNEVLSLIKLLKSLKHVR